MVYDLNMILVFADIEGGPLRDQPQRDIVSILDGIVAGEGNGPLQPLPVNANAMLASRNPFLVDFGMAKLMGFDFRKIRLLNNYKRFKFAPLVDFDPHSFDLTLNGSRSDTGVDGIPVIQRFIPSPGWRGHIELQ